MTVTHPGTNPGAGDSDDTTAPDRTAPGDAGRFNPWAELIAGRTDELRIHTPETHSYHAATWPDHEPERPYAVYLFDERRRARTLALDFDAGTNSEHAANVIADTTDAKALLDLVGLRHAEARSGPSGGRHLYITFDEPIGHRAVRALAAALKQRYTTLDISMLCNPTTGAIRPPGALHRNGGRSEIIGDEQLAREQLSTGNDHDTLVELGRLLGLDERALQRSRAPLSRRLWLILRHGNWQTQYPTMSETMAALTLSVLSRGYPLEWLEQQLADPRNQLSVELASHRRRDGSKRNGRRLLRQAGRSAARHLADSAPYRNRQDALDDIERIRDHANCHTWNGRTGLTDRAVLEALIDIAVTSGGIEFNASQRQLAEDAGLRNRRTVERSLRRLIAARWLTLCRNGRGTLASTWRLRTPGPAGAPRDSDTADAARSDAAGSDIAAAYVVGGDGLLPAGPLGHAAFAWRYLGKAAARVISVLACDGPSTATQIAARSGLHPGTIRRSLARMSALDTHLVRNDAGMWQLEPGLDIDAAARELGADQYAAELVVRHDVERQLWRHWIEAHPWIRQDPERSNAPVRGSPIAA